MKVFALQSIRVRNDIPLAQAKEMVRKKGYKPSGVTPNPQYKNYHSFRQRQPKEFKPGSFRTKKINQFLYVYGELK